jgi:protein-tyrosine phosphatase
MEANPVSASRAGLPAAPPLRLPDLSGTAVGAASVDPLWEGAVNARDLGRSAPPVLPGRLYRMGRHEWVTEAGWNQAWDQGVRTIIDLRNPFELGRRPTDPPVQPGVLARFSLVNLPTEDRSDEDFLALTGPYLNTPGLYRDNLERWPSRFAAIARAVISAPPGGVVVHCAAGRDRTGMVTALLLHAAGIPREVISEDYALAVTAINDRYRGQVSPHETPRSDDELRIWLDEAQRHLAALLSSLDAARYLLGAGLDPAELVELRARLTAPDWPGAVSEPDSEAAAGAGGDPVSAAAEPG